MDYKKNAKYFRPAPSIKPIVIGVIIALICLKVNILLAILIFAAVGVWIYVKFCGRPTDQDIDNQSDAELQQLKAAALRKLGVEEEEISFAAPIQFRGWDLINEKGRRTLGDGQIDEAWDIRGKDGRWRSPVMTFYFFAFSEHMVHYYYRCQSMVSNSFSEGTEEFAYSDVVSAKTNTVDQPAWRWVGKHWQEDPNNRMRWDSFKLTTSGGTAVTCSVMDSSIADTSVKAMRSLLKQKKIQQ